MASLALTRVALVDFRSYRRADLEVEPRPVVLTGPNGAGKTNLLEAISFLAPGRGLRHAVLQAVDRRLPVAAGEAAVAGAGAWAVAARLQRPDGPVELGTGRDPAVAAPARPRRLVKVDGAFVGSQAALARLLTVIWLTPQMDRLFLDGAGERRRFLDRLVYGFDPDHATRLNAYEHAMRERNRLLRTAVEEGRRPGEADPVWLAALEHQMATQGVAVAAARGDLVSRLAATTAGRGAFPSAGIAIDGPVDGWLAAMPALAAEDELRARLARSRARDAGAGGAQWGPHRSDLAVRHRVKGMPAADCSTGEQKALLVALVLGYARLQAAARGAAPILLLDEIAAHLDRQRREALFAELLEIGAQAWLTGTDEALFAELAGAAQFLRVRDAVIGRSVRDA